MLPAPRFSSLLFFSVRSGIEKARAHSWDFRVITDAEGFSPWWSQISDVSLRNVYRRRFQDGHRAVFAVLDGQLAFSCWIAKAELRIDEIGYRWRIHGTDICIYDCFTYPEHRGRGLYPNALAWIASERGNASVWIYCDARNQASRRGIEKAGFEAEGRITALMLGSTPLMRFGRVRRVNA